MDSGTWWWAAAGSAQLAAGLEAYRRITGNSAPTLMPFKAFVVASLFLGSASCGIPAALHVSGIRQVDDLKRVGQSLRSKLDAPPSSRSKSEDREQSI